MLRPADRRAGMQRREAGRFRRGGAPRRERADDERRARGRERGHSQDDGVDADFGQPRNVDDRRRRSQRPRGGRGHADAGRAATARHEEGFAHEFQEHGAGRGAEQALNRERLPTAFGTHEKQPGDVRARRGQHEAGRSEHHPQQRREAGDHDGCQRLDRHAHVRLLDRASRQAARKFVRQAREQRLEIGLGLLDRDAVAQTRDGLIVERRGVGFRRIQAERQPHFGVRRGKTHGIGQDADDLARFAVDRNAAIEQPGVGAEPARPQAFGKDHHGRGAGFVVGPGEEASAERRDAQRVEDAGGHATRGDALGIGGADGPNAAAPAW